MNKKKADQQRNKVRSQPVANGSPCISGKPAVDEKWVQDALEDDEVRENLKLLRARNKTCGGEPVG